MMSLRMDGYDACLCKSSWDATFGHLGADSCFPLLYLPLYEWRKVAYSSALCNIVMGFFYR